MEYCLRQLGIHLGITINLLQNVHVDFFLTTTHLGAISPYYDNMTLLLFMILCTICKALFLYIMTSETHMPRCIRWNGNCCQEAFISFLFGNND